MSKAIVTGGLGFIGSHLVEFLLKQGFEVVVIDNQCIENKKNLNSELSNRNLTILDIDVRNKSALENIISNHDIVFHLAALADIVPSIENPFNYFDTNVTGTLNLLEICKTKKISKFVYTASSTCYGIPSTTPTPEDASIAPKYPYALTKWMGEELVMHWANVYSIPAISLRLFNVYGPRSRTNGTYGAVFGVFLAQKIAGLPFTIVGSGNQTRDFTFVSDVVEAIFAASSSNLKNEILNVGSGETRSINEIVDILGGSTIHIPKRPGEPDITFADISKIKKMLDWKPKVKLEDGISTMLANIDYWKDAPRWTPESINKATQTWFKYLS